MKRKTSGAVYYIVTSVGYLFWKEEKGFLLCIFLSQHGLILNVSLLFCHLKENESASHRILYKTDLNVFPIGSVILTLFANYLNATS